MSSGLGFDSTICQYKSIAGSISGMGEIEHSNLDIKFQQGVLYSQTSLELNAQQASWPPFLISMYLFFNSPSIIDAGALRIPYTLV